MNSNEDLVERLVTEQTILQSIAATVVHNETVGGAYGSLAALAPDMTEEEAYQVQNQAVTELVEAGDVRIGKKIAATNDASLKLLGLDEPAHGVLLASMRITDGGALVANRFANARIECEIAFRLGQALTGPDVSTADVLAATDEIVASFEFVDLRNPDWALTMREVISYDGLAKHYLLAPQGFSAEGLDLKGLNVTLYKNGEQAATGDGTAVMGDPLVAVAWLANKLISQGQVLNTGDVILSGSMTPPLPIASGDRFEAKFDHLGSVSVHVI